MTKKKNKLDKLEVVFKKIPILNKLEADKILNIIKAIWIEPLITIFVLGLSFGVIQYYNEPSTDLRNILFWLVSLLILFVTIYVFKALYIAKEKEITIRYKEQARLKDDQTEMIKSVLKHQEGLRTEWFKGEREIIVIEHSIQKNALIEINNDTVIDETVRKYLINKILVNIDKNHEKYDNLLPQLTNEYEQFIIGHVASPPRLKASAKQIIKDLISELEHVD